MKKTLILATAALAGAAAFAALLQFANEFSFNAPDVFAALGSVAACGISLMAWRSYAPKRSVQRRAGAAARLHPAQPANAPDAAAASAWRYSTISM